MSSCPLSSAEVRSLIERLQVLEVWINQQEAAPPVPPSSLGYRQGSAVDRGTAIASQVGSALPVFPGLPSVAPLFKCLKAEGPVIDQPQLALRGAETGPGPVPAWIEDQADFICWDQAEGLQRVHLAYSAGFWARVGLDTCTAVQPIALKSETRHFVILRAPGVGGFVRFASAEDFLHFEASISGRCEGFSCETEAELSIFCFGAQIRLPPLFTKC